MNIGVNLNCVRNVIERRLREIGMNVVFSIINIIFFKIVYVIYKVKNDLGNICFIGIIIIWWVNKKWRKIFKIKICFFNNINY